MSQLEVVTGLDIGSSYVRVVVLQHQMTGEWQIIGAAEKNTEGVSKGMVTNIEDLISVISEVFEQAERMTGLPLTRAVVGISGTHIKTLESNGVVAVAKADREVSDDDVARALEAAQAVAVPANYEILHVIPKSYTIDNQVGIKDPVGLIGIRLEVITQIIMGLSSQIKSLHKCLYRAGIEIDETVFGILAAAEAVLTKKQKELGVAVVNIGSQTTSLVVYEDGDILHTAILPIGSNHITADIAIGLRTSMDTAELVKLEYGTAVAEKANKRDEIDLAKFSSAEKERTMVSVKYIAEISQARAEEILSMVNKELKKINRASLLPAGAVLTGGGSKLANFVELAKERLKLPVFYSSFPENIGNPIDKVNDPAYTTALGLALWGAQNSRGHAGGADWGGIDNLLGRFKNWSKSLWP